MRILHLNSSTLIQLHCINTHTISLHSYIAPVPMFEYSRKNNPYQPFIDDAPYFKHVGIAGVSTSVCRANYTGVRATIQNRQQRIRNKNETTQIRQQRLQKQSRNRSKNRNRNKQSNVASIVAEDTPQFVDTSRDQTAIQLRRSTRINKNKNKDSGVISFEEEVEWETLPYEQQKAKYIVCFVWM